MGGTKRRILESQEGLKQVIFRREAQRGGVLLESQEGLKPPGRGGRPLREEQIR